jgi:hypothetical protein
MRWIAALILFFVPETVGELTQQIAASGRVVEIAESPSERLSPGPMIAPGAPPVLGFRYFDASERGRFGSLGLMTDDAGH